MVVRDGSTDPAPGSQSRTRLWERLTDRLRYPPDRYLGFLALGLLALLGAVMLWTRLIGLDESFWHDEAFTVLTYSGVGPGAILFGDAAFDVNNHAAYNLLAWATTRLLPESEAIYRLWSVLPAIAGVALASWWAWRRIGAITAIAFAALAVAAPLHLELSPQARGYGLALLAATLMLIAADRLTRDYNLRTFLGFLGAGLLGIWTLFIFAIAFVGQALALLRWPRLRRPVFVMVGAAGLLSAAFYAPVLSDVLGARAEGEPISLGAALLLDRSLEWLIVPIRRPDLAWWVTLSAFALVVVAIVGLCRRREGGLALLLILPPLTFNLAFSFAGFETVPRHQFLLMIHVLLLVAIGIGELGEIAVRSRPLRPLAIGAGVAAVLVASVETLERRAQHLPLENFKQAASVVRGTGIGPVVTDSIRPEGLRYYLGDRLAVLPPTEVESLLCERGRELVYVRHLPLPRDQWWSWSPASLDCAVRGGSVRVRVPQRGERGDAIDVWIIDPRAGRETIQEDVSGPPGP